MALSPGLGRLFPETCDRGTDRLVIEAATQEKGAQAAAKVGVGEGRQRAGAASGSAVGGVASSTALRESSPIWRATPLLPSSMARSRRLRGLVRWRLSTQERAKASSSARPSSRRWPIVSSMTGGGTPRRASFCRSSASLRAGRRGGAGLMPGRCGGLPTHAGDPGRPR